jgi:hypothetical protein
MGSDATAQHDTITPANLLTREAMPPALGALVTS